MSPHRKVTMLRLTEQDLALIQKLKLHYGVTSTNEVICMALRAAVREIGSPFSPAPNKDSLLSP
jgi:Arc/MetJ family transcription regulator